MGYTPPSGAGATPAQIWAYTTRTLTDLTLAFTALKKPAYVEQSNPLSGQWYTLINVLNARIYKVAWAVTVGTGTLTNKQIRLTIDGETYTLTDTLGDWKYLAFAAAGVPQAPFTYTGTDTVFPPFEGRSILIEVMCVWSVQVSTLYGRCWYGA